MKIRPVGGYIYPDAQGFLGNTQCSKPTQLEIQNLVSNVILICQNCLLDNLHSIYLRGSCARDLLIPKYSDIDFFILTSKSLRGANSTLLRHFADLCKRNRTVTGIDASFFVVDDLIGASNFASERFLLSVQSICVFGTDIIKDIKKFQIGEEICFGLKNLGKVKRKYEIGLASNLNEDSANAWKRWYARKLLRAAFELVVEVEKRFTRDLFYCAQSFVRYFRVQETVAQQLLEIAVSKKSIDLTSEETMLQFAAWLGKQSPLQQHPTKPSITMQLTEIQSKTDEPATIQLTDDMINVAYDENRAPILNADTNDGSDGDTDKNDSNSSDN